MIKEPLIEFVDVTKSFDGRTVLDRVNFKIFEGEVSTLIGLSGSGKSVTLKHIVGLLKPDWGQILYRGKPIDRMSNKEWNATLARISYMFQNNALFDSMTVFDNIALALRRTTSLTRKEIAEKVMARIEQTELTDVAHKYPAEISGGMQKRTALARALVTDPQIVLFDEHFGLVGAFSTRQTIDEFASLLPFSNREEAEHIMNDFTRDLQEHGLESLSALIRKATSSEECFEFTILGGLARGQPQVELDSIIEFARFDLRPIARFSCERGGNSK
jgi:ABC-type nitrate/sulfonate/bicarbonate transport system ATPase subunit